jgi:hypothetical protein
MKNLSIATISWARTDEEEQLLRESLKVLSTFNIPVFITDGGSAEAFIDFIKSLPNLHIVAAQEKGLWAQAKNSLQLAQQHGSDCILYTEPDKLLFFRDHLRQFIHAFDAATDSGIYLASRTAKGFATFPSFQRMSETTINNCCAETTGCAYDFTYGPFIFNSNLLAHIHHLPADIGWGWRPYMFGLAARLALSIDQYEDEFVCPPDQRNDSAGERIYRMKQLEQNIRGIILASAVSLT